MTSARAVATKLAVLTALAALGAVASRGLLASFVGRHIDDGVEALRDAASRLPVPREDVRRSAAPLPPPPPAIASAIASTVISTEATPARAPSNPIATKSKSQTKPTDGKKPTAQIVTRAEVEDAIATKCHGVHATLVRDDAGAPIGLALHRVGSLSRFGVAEGDVLVAANGRPLRTPDEAIAALGALKDAQRVSVAVRRGDATFVVTLAVEAPE